MFSENANEGATCACKGIRRCLICEKIKGNVPLGEIDAKVNLIALAFHMEIYKQIN